MGIAVNMDKTSECNDYKSKDLNNQITDWWIYVNCQKAPIPNEVSPQSQ